MTGALLTLVLAGSAGSHAATVGAPRWERCFDDALRQAASSGRPVLVDFWAKWCTWCDRMQETTYRSPAVVEAGRGFVWVRIDVEGSAKEKIAAMRYGVSNLPTVVFLSPSGRQLGRAEGFQGAGAFPSTLLAAREAASRVMGWEATLATSPQDPGALAALGQHLFEQDYYDDAAQLLLASTARDEEQPAPDRRRTRMTLAVIQNHQRNFRSAESLLKEALQLGPPDPDDATLLFLLGRIYFNAGRESEAEETFRILVQQHSDSTAAQRARDTLIRLQTNSTQ